MSEEKKGSSRRDFLKIAGSFVAGAVVAGAGVSAMQPPSGPSVTRTVTATETMGGPTVAGPAAHVWGAGQNKVWIPILNKLMSYDDVVAEIQAEGKVSIANWTYWGLIDSYFTPSLKKYVKDLYGVDIDVEFLGTQAAKGGWVVAVESALAAGQSAPFDLMHIEDNFFTDAVSKGIAEPFLPSPLVPWAQFVDSFFLRFPYGVQFQQHALANFTINTNHVGDWFQTYKDLADSRLKGKLTLWPSSDNGLWGWWAIMAQELGYDYHKPSDMQKAIKWVADNIHPNVLKYTDDEGELGDLLEKELSWISAYWCCLGEGYAITKPELKGAQVLPQFKSTSVNLPGVYWIPKKAEHPLLAQIAADWELSAGLQMTDITQWQLAPDVKTSEQLWAMALEGPLSEDYMQYVPDWVNQMGPNGIFGIYPTIEQAKSYPKLDWGYINSVVGDWINYWKQLTAAP
jgi:spermidine/putrescine-binding protein